jgi:hypothetical protein
MPRLELLQQYLQQWDILEKSMHWLCGANNLNHYDDVGLLLDRALAKADFNEICLALELARWSDDGKLSFMFYNHKYKDKRLQDEFEIRLRKGSKRNKNKAKILMALFRDPDQKVSRRVQPCKQK